MRVEGRGLCVGVGRGSCAGPAPARVACARCGVGKAELGGSGISVSRVTLGTMLFGESTGYGDACKLMDMAFEAGVNTFDSAEMYPVPQCAATAGKSEEFLGKWLANRQRDQVVVCTKICGPSGEMTWIRGGPNSLDRQNILAAVDQSLSRLGTDYIDLMQLHWPDRYVPMFGEVDYQPSWQYTSVPIEEQLDALGECISAGKIRSVGLSNETPWGLMKFVMEGKKRKSRPQPVSIQNSYSLLDRKFDSGVAECCHAENISFLAYSTLAMGLLTGKYLRDDGGPRDARLNKYKNRYGEAESRYGKKPNVEEAVLEYCGLAKESGITPVELATRFVSHHPLLTSMIIGATTTDQLQELLAAAAKPALESYLAEEIDRIHKKYPNPSP